MPHLINTPNHFLASILYLIEEVEDVWQGRDAWFRDEQGLSSSVFIEGTQEYYKATRYLPRGEAERPDDYLKRLRQADWKPKYRQAIEKDFSSILTQFNVVDEHPSIKDALNDFDGNGNSLHIIVKDWISQALHLGMAGIFVDFPKENDATNIAEYQAMGLRPTATIYSRRDVIDWKFQRINGMEQLVSVTLRDWVEVEEDDDAMTRTKMTERYKKLFLVSDDDGKVNQAYKLYEIYKGKDDEKPIEKELDSGLTIAPRITFTPLGMSRKPFYADLPLVHFARLNVQLYRKEANRDYYLDKCACPTLVANDIVGSSGGSRTGKKVGDKQPIQIAIGPNTVLRNIEAKWLELSGVSMKEIKTDIEGLLLQLDEEALAFLSGAGNKTATQSIIDTFQTQANLIGMATFLESAMQSMFRDFAGYATGDFAIEDAGSIDLSMAIDTLKMAMNGTVEDIFAAIFEGVITRELGLKLLKARGFFGRSFTDADMAAEMQRQGMLQGQTINAPMAAPQQGQPLGI